VKTSRLPNFYKLPLKERLRVVKEFSALTDKEESLLLQANSLPQKLAESMIENVVGTIPIPLGVTTDFLINKKDYLIPMATEEPLVVAAASFGAKLARECGWFSTNSTKSLMIGQIQTVKVGNPYEAKKAVLDVKGAILEKANEGHRRVRAEDLDARVVRSRSGLMLVVELYVDCKDAMGANVVNTMAEEVAPLIERVTKGRVYLRIVSNLATKRLARASVKISRETVGREVAEKIVRTYEAAVLDEEWAATYNKFVMDGVSAVMLATCNDHRAVEAGAHAYAALKGRYGPLCTWSEDENENILGAIELPMAVGVIGGAVKVHPVAKLSLKILGVKTARELAEVAVATGLAENLGRLMLTFKSRKT